MPRVLFPLALLLVPSLSAADHVTVKGTVLEGKVKAISSKEVVMETVYGKGDLTIPTADVSAIETDVPFHVFQADDGVAVGNVVGITPAAVTVAQESGPNRCGSTAWTRRLATPAPMATGSHAARWRTRGGAETSTSPLPQSTPPRTP